MRPIISIIVPVYNAEQTIDRCIESVLNQTLPSFELILIDDGSKDASSNRCNDYAKDDSRIRVIHQNNKGVSAARNVGLDCVSGRYVFFLDSDDELASNTLKTYLELAEKYNADAILGSLAVISGNVETISGFSEEKLYGNTIWEEICLNPHPFGWAGGKMYKVDTVGEVRFNEAMHSQEDFDFNLEIYHQCKSVVCTPFTGYKYYRVNNQREPQILDYILNQTKLLKFADNSTELTYVAKKAVLSRIASLIYTTLYNANSRAEFNHYAEGICGLQELTMHSGDFKRYKVKHYLSVEQILDKKYAVLYVYMRVRRKCAESMRSYRK